MEDLREQYEVNVIGAVRVSQAFLPMLRRYGGRVVNMGSLTARVSLPFADDSYSSSKSALTAMTHEMRRELEPLGVRVALVEPETTRPASGTNKSGAWRPCSQGRAPMCGGPTKELCGPTSRRPAGCEPEAQILGAWRGRSSMPSTQRNPGAATQSAWTPGYSPWH
jgi:NAD(P)-dependent dehydrogenase (short-subunit alcohol dehydrogenase family)